MSFLSVAEDPYIQVTALILVRQGRKLRDLIRDVSGKSLQRCSIKECPSSCVFPFVKHNSGLYSSNMEPVMEVRDIEMSALLARPSLYLYIRTSARDLNAGQKQPRGMWKPSRQHELLLDVHAALAREIRIERRTVGNL